MSKSERLVQLKRQGYLIPEFIVIRNVDELRIKSELLCTNKFYAVRSSANIEDGNEYSFAGIFNSYALEWIIVIIFMRICGIFICGGKKLEWRLLFKK